jgi:hypothetical protein
MGVKRGLIIRPGHRVRIYKSIAPKRIVTLKSDIIIALKLEITWSAVLVSKLL